MEQWEKQLEAYKVPLKKRVSLRTRINILIRKRKIRRGYRELKKLSKLLCHMAEKTTAWTLIDLMKKHECHVKNRFEKMGSKIYGK